MMDCMLSIKCRLAECLICLICGFVQLSIICTTPTADKPHSNKPNQEQIKDGNKWSVRVAKRTPIGSFLGSLAAMRSAPHPGAVAIKALLAETGVAIPEAVDEVIMGNVLTTGGKIRRAAGAGRGHSDGKTATTVNVVCGSGMKALQMAAQAIMCGDAEIVVAGGQESMSQSPHFMHMRGGLKMGDGKLVDSMVSDGLTDADAYHMGITAENIVEKIGISREAQEHWRLLRSKKRLPRAPRGGLTQKSHP